MIHILGGVGCIGTLILVGWVVWAWHRINET
jgi:hypothetical protein